MSLKFVNRYLTLIQAFGMAIKGFHTNNNIVLLVTLNKIGMDNDIIDVTKYKEDIDSIIEKDKNE